MTWLWLWCWCRFMSASPGFHFWLLSGSRAHRDTCVPPSLSCESFWVLNTVHFIHFHFHLFVIVITELNFFAWVLNSSSYHSNMNSLYASTPTQPCAHQILCAIYLVEVDKKFTLQGWILLQNTMSWYMKWYRARINKNVILKREKLSSYCFWF